MDCPSNLLTVLFRICSTDGTNKELQINTGPGTRRGYFMEVKHMKFKYYPDDIAAALASIAGVKDHSTIDAASGALYDLKSICENRYNSEYLRDFWRLLEAVTDTAQ